MQGQYWKEISLISRDSWLVTDDVSLSLSIKAGVLERGLFMLEKRTKNQTLKFLEKSS